GFKKLWPGSYTLEAPNCVVLDQEPRDPFRGEQVLEGATLDVGVLKIEKPAHLRCTVRDMRTHKPVSRALINATWPGTEGISWPQTWEASDAGVADVVVRTGEIKLSVSGIEARRTVRADQPCYVLMEIDANLPGVYGEHSNEELPSTIVTVVDAAGSPVPFANIEEVHGFGRYLSDAHGQFDLDGFNPDSEIWVRKGGLATRNSAYTGSDTSVRSTSFRLGAGVLGGARGRIRDVGGRDLVGAVVDITDEDPQWVYGVYATFITGPHGSFKVEGLYPGAEFRIVYRGAASAWFSVRAGELKELGDVQLTESPKYD
ncbi:MAG TPA: carboxypeptidase-like regulatory domain-containing protein, partial [Fimbriimonadaceae bacterium]|nr:carboxypeptidase-like regulatory domain-containing protein [Fimbriimonadaceae bacterium]